MTTRILIVNEEMPLTALLRYLLEGEGYVVDAVMRSAEAEPALRENPPDLIILDTTLPDISGIELCQRLRLRPETQRIPIMMLTARGEEAARICGFATGADDFLVKPFSPAEFLVRVQALLRRTNPSSMGTILCVADIELDRDRHRVTRGQREVHLGPTEFRLLEFLMRSPGRVFSRRQLLAGVWGQEVDIDERTVDVHIGRLRRAINMGSRLDPIRTVRGAGYSFKEEQYLRADATRSCNRSSSRDA